MTILQIENMVPNFEQWKKAFDNDPAGRKEKGVTAYRVYRFKDNPDYVIIDLQFENTEDAESMLKALYTLWKKIEGTVMFNPKTRILNLVESAEI
jgi:hypothetical protein